MLRVTRVSSILTLRPTLPNSAAAGPLSDFSSLKTSIRFRGTARINPLKHYSLSPQSRILNVGSARACHSRGFCGSRDSGEFHVVVGPMFAGKTTTLLKRMKYESSNGRFQADATSCYLDRTLKDLCFTGRIKEAVATLCCTGVHVDSKTYSLLLEECIFRKEYEKGRRIHWQMVVVGFVPDEYLKIKLLILYAKSGDLITANILFDLLVMKNIISWNALIAGYVQKGLEEQGLSLYHRMRQHGWMPDQYTFATVFRACSSLAILEQGKQAHGVLVKSQVKGNVVVISALVDMYFKCSSPRDGFQVFDKSPERNVITWTSLISGYGLHGRVFEVIDSFHQMINDGFMPNQVTFLALLSACSHGGLVGEGREYFSSMMRDYGVRPRGKHYAVMVDLLGRSGRIEEAYSFVRMSPSKDHPAVWGALLGACRMHGNVYIAELAAEKFFDLEPVNAGKYIVLSNAYATLGLWKNVSDVRRVMKGSGVKKEPGYSMIEVQNEANFFFMGYNTHKQIKQILRVVKDLSCTLKDPGDISDLSDELDQVIVSYGDLRMRNICLTGRDSTQD